MGWFEDLSKGAQGVSNAIGHGIVDAAEWVGDTASNVGEAFVAPITMAGALYDLINIKPEVESYNAAAKKRKYNPPKIKIKVLGVEGLSIHERTEGYISGNVRVDFLITDANSTVDTTTYTDRAVIKLYNGLGYNCYLTSLTIDGKRIMQYSGEAGELIHDSLKRDDDIRRNGETVFEIGNEYIVTADQCAKIADYWYKFLGKKKHLYSLSIPGCAPWYNVGDWYNLKIGEADRNEYIDAVVECYAVDVEKSAGSIGSTTLLLRDVEDNWSKTTLYTTRLATGGSPKRRVNRSNIVTVASSTYDGTYDYKCDGTDDDVQIQAAIDYVSNTWGGGTVLLTNGTYTLGATLAMKSAIILKGVGNSTILSPESASVTTMVDFGTDTGSSVDDFTVDGNGASITFLTDGMVVIDGQNLGIASNIAIQNYSFAFTSGSNNARLFYEIKANGCSALGNNITNSGIEANIRAFESCINLLSCEVKSNTASGASSNICGFYRCTTISACLVSSNSTQGTSSKITGFDTCSGISSCIFELNNTTGSSAFEFAFFACADVSGCSVSQNTTSGASAHFYGFRANTLNISSCSVFSNSTSGAGALVFAYQTVIRAVACSATSNTSTLSTSYGFHGCNSVQQCKSTGHTIQYNTSYADSGTANACADTSAGGYNS